MPAASSSPVDPVFCHLFAAADGLDGDRATVLSVLAAVADPRARRGVRHRLAVILALTVCAVLAGARSFTAIAEWAADTDERSALESHSALPVTVIGIDELASRWAARTTPQARGQDDLHRVEDSFVRFAGARRRIEIACDTLQASADQIEQRCEMMWWLV